MGFSDGGESMSASAVSLIYNFCLGTTSRKYVHYIILLHYIHAQLDLRPPVWVSVRTTNGSFSELQKINIISCHGSVLFGHYFSIIITVSNSNVSDSTVSTA